jgi:Zn-dependent protease/CBS domain-containing protein
MKNSLFIGRIAGIKIFIHWTFPLIILWIIFANSRQGMTAAQTTWTILFVLALFICVILHELGHALAAKKYHIKTKDITLLPIGGVARMESMPENPRHELVVALAGPAVNVLIFFILYAALSLVKVPWDFSTVTYINADNFFLNLALLNIWLALFNLIPAFPMDGGRVLRALLALRMNRMSATRIAARIGQALAIVFVFAGILFNPFLIFIGLFIFLGAAAEAEQVQTQSLLKGHTVEHVTMQRFPVLNRTDSIEKAVEMLLNGQAKNFLVMDGKLPFGTLSRDGIIRALSAHGGNAPVEMVAETNPVFIETIEPVENALRLFQQNKHSLLIVTRQNHFYGVVDLENILEYIMVMEAGSARKKH